MSNFKSCRDSRRKRACMSAAYVGLWLDFKPRRR